MPLTDLEKQQHEVLREIEWSTTDFDHQSSTCPVCHGYNPIHYSNCRLMDALMAAAAANQATSAAHDPHATDITDLQPAPFPSTPLCPTCNTKAIYQSAESWTDQSRVCSCPDGHTWVLDAAGAEI